MFEFIGGIFSFALGMVKMGISLAWGAVQFVVGLLGGIFSLIMSLGGFFLAGALVLLAFSPTASASPGWTGELDGDVGLASALGSVSILCSIVIILFLLVVLV